MAAMNINKEQFDKAMAEGKAILVDSTDTYLWYFWPRRLAELPFRKERP